MVDTQIMGLTLVVGVLMVIQPTRQQREAVAVRSLDRMVAVCFALLRVMCCLLQPVAALALTQAPSLRVENRGARRVVAFGSMRARLQVVVQLVQMAQQARRAVVAAVAVVFLSRWDQVHSREVCIVLEVLVLSVVGRARLDSYGSSRRSQSRCI